MKPTVIDLFSGCGGFSHGFGLAGFKTVGFVEWWPPAIKTFQLNHPDAEHLGTDIRKVKNSVLEKFAGNVDVVIGGPPCQGFSLAGQRDKDDERNQMYKEFLRVVQVINPKVTIIENVVGLVSMRDVDGEKIIDKITHRLIALGYAVKYKFLDASLYGVPQKRKRLIIIGKKVGWFPIVSHKRETVLDAVRGLSEEENGMNGHLLFNTKEQTQERIKNLKEGENMCNTYKFSRQRLHGDKPSKTVVTQTLFVHPQYDRFLTPRELARLQSFPDSFLFCGSKGTMVKQIGNAVPPALAHAIAKRLKEGDYV